jgi:hypothetical protein
MPPVKVIVTDLKTRIMYRGSLREGVILGLNLHIPLDNKPGYALTISKVRGWLISDSHKIWYLISGDGKRYKMRVLDQTAIDSKL